VIPVTPEAASINRIVIVDLPGQPVDHEVRDRRASYLLSVPALIRYAHAAADALAMPRALREADPELPETRRDLPRWVDGCLTRPDPQVRMPSRGASGATSAPSSQPCTAATPPTAPRAPIGRIVSGSTGDRCARSGSGAGS